MESWFSKGLTKWYKQNKRDLPWRSETDPYKIWLSEIILQQTQVAQGTSYYLKFIAKYPKAGNLASANEDEVLKLWQGLGYYSRARNLHATAKIIKSNYAGVFPSTYEEIRALKGIGDYTASAISSFAYNLPFAVVDGNVYRLLSRLFGIDTPIDSGVGKKEFQALANELLDKKNPAEHNQAIMEFGSQFCKPNNPDCENCIFNSKCLAFKTNRVKELPIKSKKIKISNRFLNYVVIVDKNNNVLLNKRAESDIWKGLYEFYLIESKKEISIDKLFKTPEFNKIATSKFKLLHSSKNYKHILSHQHLYAKFYVIKAASIISNTLTTSKINNLNNFAFSRLTEKFLNDCDLKEIV
ncbi:A/G-specific adenine glycosylase [Sediminibacterium sp.]|uniref:A/G-specific adenine glycosylase n=1 Tax=Sediminibacterium sp. TaxID=1917865 RepID=UPI0027201EA7|nr:A/G-specific adenine glycosylase [Sediminibacterium sp.]MDO9000407.1 A/G-specific adenine glycosylase [Bacteroidota bacterium]MDP3147025.1 A/G-specific adenine glycosylase [Bacteroidota bacterium]MDP3567438.1 A/G-specific adenine glycosylase [Sediminibacterium sp.]